MYSAQKKGLVLSERKPRTRIGTWRKRVEGFTLIELLVVIAIIAVLSVVGITVFAGVQKGARDAKRRGDIDAVSKAYETKYASGVYQAVTDQDFASGSIPQDPTKGYYFNVLSSGGSGFKVCAALEANPADACNTSATNCFCRVSNQGIIAQGSSLSGTRVELGLGGGSSPDCDPNGTLYAGLMGYWKTDEGSWTGAAGEVLDSSGNGNNGVAYGGANTISGKFGNAGSFDGIDDYLSMGNGASLGLISELTYEAWFKRNAGGDSVQAIVSHYWRPVLWFYTNRFVLTVDEGVGGYWFANGTTNPTVGVWYHVVGVFSLSEGKMKIYVNGVLEGSVDKNTAINLSPGQPVIIGANYVNPSGDRANGFIDDVRIYNRALSSQEISSLYNSGNGCI